MHVDGLTIILVLLGIPILWMGICVVLITLSGLRRLGQEHALLDTWTSAKPSGIVSGVIGWVGISLFLDLRLDTTHAHILLPPFLSIGFHGASVPLSAISQEGDIWGRLFCYQIGSVRCWFSRKLPLVDS